MIRSHPTRTLDRPRREAAHRLLELAGAIQAAVFRLGLSPGDLASVHRQAPTDVLYRLDQEVDHLIRHHFEDWGPLGGVAVTGEGFESAVNGGMGPTVFPSAQPPASPKWHVILDPVDGTRGLMWDKRPGFFLAALAEGDAPATYRESFFAVVSELPTTKMYRADTFYAVRDHGAWGDTVNLLNGKREERPPSPFTGDDLRHGFAGITRYFAPGRGMATALDDALMSALMPEIASGKPLVFEDQFITSGGQLFEMLCGRDRFIGELRGWIGDRRAAGGEGRLMTSHPYDLAGALVATEAGILLTGLRGEPLDFPWDTSSTVDYLAYANGKVRALVEPVLTGLMANMNE